jgi:phosphoribosylformylglycinamidine synthase
VVACAHDLSDGGLLCAAAEAALAANVGVALFNPTTHSPAAFAFGEDQGRYLIAVPPSREAEAYKAAAAAGVPAEPIGVAGGEEIVFEDDGVALSALRRAHEGWLPSYMAKLA